MPNKFMPSESGSAADHEVSVTTASIRRDSQAWPGGPGQNPTCALEIFARSPSLAATATQATNRTSAEQATYKRQAAFQARAKNPALAALGDGQIDLPTHPGSSKRAPGQQAGLIQKRAKPERPWGALKAACAAAHPTETDGRERGRKITALLAGSCMVCGPGTTTSKNAQGATVCPQAAQHGANPKPHAAHLAAMR